MQEIELSVSPAELCSAEQHAELVALRALSATHRLPVPLRAVLAGAKAGAGGHLVRSRRPAPSRIIQDGAGTQERRTADGAEEAHSRAN